MWFFGLFGVLFGFFLNKLALVSSSQASDSCGVLRFFHLKLHTEVSLFEKFTTYFARKMSASVPATRNSVYLVPLKLHMVHVLHKVLFHTGKQEEGRKGQEGQTD